jgi:hypothetical protein
MILFAVDSCHKRRMGIYAARSERHYNGKLQNDWGESRDCCVANNGLVENSGEQRTLAGSCPAEADPSDGSVGSI